MEALTRDASLAVEIESEIAKIEAIPESQRQAADEKHLGVLRDTRMFDCEYFLHVRNGKGGRERISPIIGKNAGN